MVSQGCSWPPPTPCPLGPLPAPRPPSPLPSTLQRGGPHDQACGVAHSRRVLGEHLLPLWGGPWREQHRARERGEPGPPGLCCLPPLPWQGDREGVQASEGPLWSFLPLGMAALPRWRCGVVDPLLLVRPTPLARCPGAGCTPRQLARCRVFCVARGGAGRGGPVHRAEGVAEQGLRRRAWVTGCRPFQHVTFP